MHRYAGFTLAVLATSCWGQSVADAARASQQRHQTSATRKIVTNDDVPVKTGVDNPSSSDLDPVTRQQLDNLRAVYLKNCQSSGPRQRTPEMKRQLQEAAEPLQNRLQQNTSRSAESESRKLSHEEEAQIQAIVGNEDAPLTLEQRQKIGAIRQEYSDKRKGLANEESRHRQQSAAQVIELLSMVSECAKATSSRF
jgi:hypothetical protein